jgi:hypothetical protein
MSVYVKNKHKIVHIILKYEEKLREGEEDWRAQRGRKKLDVFAYKKTTVSKYSFSQ